MSATETTTPPEVGLRVDVDGIGTNYHRAGDGPPLLLVHGSGPGVSAFANWRPVLPALAERFDVVAPDVVGFGYTDRPDGFPFTLDAWRGHLLGFLDALGLERVSVVGNSFGGALALSLAVHAPERVERLVLMGSAGVSFPITEGLDRVWGYEPSVAAMRDLLDLFAFDRSLATDELARMRHAASVRPGVQESFAAMFPAPRQEGVDRLATPEEQLRGIRHRTLLVHGRDDRVIPLESSLRLLRLVDDSRLHVFGRCGHWTQIEHADAFARLVTDFLGAP
ncbi:alpha/beta fold hydrolase [Arthrobacter sp. NEB 688]|uniref:alpha/beta fold hydrolase n=1 Tax=Arthrobacter sp. NEB 688 TaxID=904039 RepID=UPI0015657E7E|nr:alpha/beta fold hydrolase [Arthrobacter sp. NEB 688]QKE85037.1 alpha/beta fold hydrolase [Arthrobacter sp. NEB 688]